MDTHCLPHRRESKQSLRSESRRGHQSKPKPNTVRFRFLFYGSLIGKDDETDIRVRKNASVYTRVFFFAEGLPLVGNGKPPYVPLILQAHATVLNSVCYQFDIQKELKFFIKSAIIKLLQSLIFIYSRFAFGKNMSFAFYTSN